MSFFKKLFLGESVKTVGKASFKALSKTEPTPEEPTTPEEDELQGYWILNEQGDLLNSNIRGMSFNVNLTLPVFINYPNTLFTSLYTREDSSDNICFLYGGGAITSTVFRHNYNAEFGIRDKGGILKISSKLSEVENGEELLSWLKANATKYKTLPEKTFTLEDEYSEKLGEITTLTYIQGMTWAEWVMSIYNTVGLRNNGDSIGRNGWKISLNSEYVKETDYVQSTEYKWNTSPIHGGGSN